NAREKASFRGRISVDCCRSKGARNSSSLTRLDPSLYRPLEIILSRLAGAQDLRDSKEFQNAKLLDRRLYEQIGRLRFDLLRCDRPLHDLRGPKHRVEGSHALLLAAKGAEGHVDRDHDVGAIKKEVVGQGIYGAAVKQKPAVDFDRLDQA